MANQRLYKGFSFLRIEEIYVIRKTYMFDNHDVWGKVDDKRIS